MQKPVQDGTVRLELIIKGLLMPEYRFSYKRGRVTASFGITAANDTHAFKRMQVFIKQHSVAYIAGSMKVCDESNRWQFLAKPKASQKRKPLAAALQAAE